MTTLQKLTAATAFTVAAALALLFANYYVSRISHAPQPQVSLWQYRGHDMLRVNCQGQISVCHSPECRKCIQVYD